MPVRPLLASLAVLVVLAARADDDFLRCGSKLIDNSMAMSEVLAHCGEPTRRTVEEVPQHVRRANGTTYIAGTITVETWTYDRGRSRFPAVLRFEDSKLISIELVRR